MIGNILNGAMAAMQSRLIQALSALVVFPVAASALHTTGVSGELDTTVVARGLTSADLWLAIGIAAAFGGLGGVVAELLSLHGHVELPHRVHARPHVRRLADPRYEVDLGIFSRIILGTAAALAFLALQAPATGAMLVVNSLVAGSAATAVFRLVQGRMLAKSQKDQSKKLAETTPRHTRLTLVAPARAGSSGSPALRVDQVEH